MPTERKLLKKKDKPAPFNVPTDHALPSPPAAMGAAYGPLTAPPSLGPTAPVNLVSNVAQDTSPSFLVPLPVSPQSVGNLSPLNVNGSESSEEEEEEDPVSSPDDDKEHSDDDKEHSDDDKEFSNNLGPDSYISKKMKQVEDLDECAEILKLVNARFKYLNLETCLCGKRLTKNYVESRTCKTCTLEQNKKNIPMCGNCHLVSLKGKFIEIGFCKKCSNLLLKEELMKMRLVKK